MRPLPRRTQTTPKKMKRRKTEFGYLNDTLSLRKRRPANAPSSSSEEDGKIVLDDSSADEADDQPPVELPEVCNVVMLQNVVEQCWS